MKSKIKWMKNFLQDKSQHYFLGIASFGVSSGIASYFLYSTIAVWLADSGVSASQRSILLWASLPYTLKLFLSPLIETMGFGILTRKLGRKKSWVLVTQSGIVLSIIALSFVNLPHHTWLVVPLCFLLALCGSLQDSTLEGYRIQMTPPDQQSVGAQANASGFRLGMWIASYIPLLLAHYISWRVAFWGVAVFVALGMVVVSRMKEPPPSPLPFPRQEYYTRYLLLLKESVLFFKKTYFLGSVLLLIASYKLGDIFIRALWSPFLLDQGYTTADLAEIDKSLGLVSMLLGIYCGSRLIAKRGIRWTMRLWAVAQAVGTLLFLFQAVGGKSYALLITSLAVNNFIGGIGATLGMTYFSDLCQPNKQAVVVDYALLTSFGSFSRLVSNSLSELSIDWVNWPTCFVLSFIACIPVFLMTWSSKPFMKKNER